MSRGIVTCAGGERYFLNAYILCSMLKEHGSELPVEWHYMGDEMPPEWIDAVNELGGVTLVDHGGDAADKAKGRGGWQLKSEAVLASSFDEIIFLDADCFPLRAPAYLFDHEFYRSSSGCVLWPDPYCWSQKRLAELKELYGVDLPVRQVESGQMMFDKRKCLPGIRQVVALNRDHEKVYRTVYGDKDTFLIGMLQTGIRPAVVPHYLRHLPYGMMHKDFDGREMFCHLAGGKFAKHGRTGVRASDLPLVHIAKMVADDFRAKGILTSVALRARRQSQVPCPQSQT